VRAGCHLTCFLELRRDQEAPLAISPGGLGVGQEPPPVIFLLRLPRAEGFWRGRAASRTARTPRAVCVPNISGALFFLETRIVAGHALTVNQGLCSLGRARFRLVFLKHMQHGALCSMTFFRSIEGKKRYPFIERRVRTALWWHHEIPAHKRAQRVAGFHVSSLAGAAPAVDHPQLSAQLARVGIAGVGLMIGPLLVIAVAQDRSGAPAAIPR
jgi:hypothetical protein